MLKYLLNFVLNIILLFSCSSASEEYKDIVAQESIKILRAAQLYKDFEEGNIELCKTTTTNFPPTEKANRIRETQENAKAADIIFDKLKQFIEGDMMPARKLNNALSYLLDVRFQYLAKRANQQEKMRATVNLAAGSLPFLLPGTLPLTMEVFKQTGERFNYLCAQIATDRFQHLNRLIRDIYQLTLRTKTPLWASTKTLIRASVTLWPFMKGESDNAGHPDMAILTYEGEDQTIAKDIRYYGAYIRKHIKKGVPKHQWDRQKVSLCVTPEEAGLPMEFSLASGLSIKLPLLYPDWLQQKIPTLELSKVRKRAVK